MVSRRFDHWSAPVAGVIWAALWWQAFTNPDRFHALLSVSGIVTTVAAFLTPYLVARVIATHWRAPFYAQEAAVGWGTFTTLIVFVGPAPAPPLWEVVLFLASLTVALATVFSAIAHVTALRLTGERAGHRFVAARRRGYLAATCVVASGLLAGSSLFSPSIAVLMVAICVVIELLIAACRPTPRAIARRT
jgi:hypothetical protein